MAEQSVKADFTGVSAAAACDDYSAAVDALPG